MSVIVLVSPVVESSTHGEPIHAPIPQNVARDPDSANRLPSDGRGEVDGEVDGGVDK